MHLGKVNQQRIEPVGVHIVQQKHGAGFKRRPLRIKPGAPDHAAVERHIHLKFSIADEDNSTWPADPEKTFCARSHSSKSRLSTRR